MKENITLIKAEDFALKIIKLYKILSNREIVIAKQILRSGTSIGANISEAECSISLKDMLSKLYISLKECNETLYWLGLLYKSGYIGECYKELYDDCLELKKILISSTKTLTKRLNNE